MEEEILGVAEGAEGEEVVDHTMMQDLRKKLLVSGLFLLWPARLIYIQRQLVYSRFCIYQEKSEN